MKRVLALGLAAWAIYGVVGLLPTQPFRAVHVAIALAVLFVATTPGAAPRGRRAMDVLLGGTALLVFGRVAWDLDGLAARSARPSPLDLACGVLALLLVMEAARRAAGWVLPAVVALSLLYAMGGAWLPRPWTHRGYGLGRLVGLEYMGLEGLFGVPVAVSATLIVLFTLFGALLDRSGAGQFYVDLALAAVGRRRSGAARAVTLASFLLGGPSGSGVATAVTVGSVAWPLLRRAGYDAERAGGLLSAAGIGAVLSPPVMGAASFLIAELTQSAYVDVLKWALVPAALYYVSVLVMAELDARTLGLAAVDVEALPLARLIRGGWPYLLPVIVLAALLVLGWTAERAVLASMVLTVAVSFATPRPLGPRALGEALADGAAAVAPIAATCAAAGILVGVVNLTGLGHKLSGLLVDAGGGHLMPTAFFAALVLLVLGLALPITASYLIAAVIVAPGLTRLGVPQPAAHLFVFVYALLSEVTPPTALSCLAVSAITGGNPGQTMLRAWRYTLPAFLLPFAFVAPGGMALLLVGPPLAVAQAVLTAGVGIVAIAFAAGSDHGRMARASYAVGGLLLLAADGRADAAGAALLALAMTFHNRLGKAPAVLG